jgi:hypothetical protein
MSSNLTFHKINLHIKIGVRLFGCDHAIRPLKLWGPCCAFGITRKLWMRPFAHLLFHNFWTNCTKVIESEVILPLKIDYLLNWSFHKELWN